MYLDARMDRLKRYDDSIHTAHVTLSTEKHMHRAEIVLRVDGKDFASKETSEDMYSAVDRVSDKLETQLRRHKDRRKTGRRSGRGSRDNGHLSGTIRVLRADTVGSGADHHDVVRAADFPILTMTVDEAILKLEQAQESFVVFANRATDLIHVVYKQDDGNYGVLNLHATH
jgi:putative sigma-54 modulation protein